MKNSKSKKESNITHGDFLKTLRQLDTLCRTLRSEHPEFIDAVKKVCLLTARLKILKH